MSQLPKTRFTGYWGRAYHFDVDATLPGGAQRWYSVTVTRREAVYALRWAPHQLPVIERARRFAIWRAYRILASPYIDLDPRGLPRTGSGEGSPT